MGNRPVKRKVTIVFEGRDPKDSAALLKAVADELRPNDVEIRFTAGPEEDPPSRPDEELETRAKEDAAKALDRKARKLRVAREGAAPTSAVPPESLAAKCWRVGTWLGHLGGGGWRFTVNVVLPAAERVAKIYKDVHG